MFGLLALPSIDFAQSVSGVANNVAGSSLKDLLAQISTLFEKLKVLQCFEVLIKNRPGSLSLPGLCV